MSQQTEPVIAMAELDEVAIFNAARKIELPDDRDAYLRQACGEDRAAYERVAALLSAYEAEPSFLESPPAEVGPRIDAASIPEGPGTVIGRYKLLERIGEGGFAVVYMAEQTEPIRRQVALKVIKLGMDTRQVIARFEAERQALAMMDHPGIAEVYDAGATETGRPYFVMQLIRGTPITDYCDRNRLPTEARLRLFLDVCHAVQHAHQKGIIHRDVKPTNVLVALHDGRPVPKVIDFGIAKATHQRLTEKTLFTNYRQIIGTPQYMSPEQAEFSDLDVDTRSDIYSLGVLLYELLTGTTPFQPDELARMAYDEICRTIRHSEPPTPSRRLTTLGAAAAETAENRRIDPVGLHKRLRGDLDWIVMKALEKDRKRRYETADALALDVERHLAGEPIRARRTSRIERLWRWGRRNRLIAALSLAVATLITLVAITAPMIAWQQARLVDETRQQLYAKDVSIAYNAWNDGDLAHTRELLDRYAVGSRYAHLRDFPWHYLDGLYQRATAGFMAGERFDISLGTNLAAVAKSDNLIHLYDAQSWAEVGTLPWTYQALADFRFSPDGRFLTAAYPNGTLSVWEISSRKQLYTITVDTHASDVYSPRFSPDGSILATGGPDHDVKIWESATGKLLRVLSGHQADVSALAFSPDGKTLATASYDHSLRLWDTETWKTRAVFEDAIELRVYGLAYDPTGTRFASGGYREEICIWDDSGRKIASLPTYGSSLCFSPDGRLLAVGGSFQGTLQVWNVDEQKLVAEYRVGHGPAYLAFVPNGEFLICSDGKLMRRDLCDRAEPVVDQNGYYIQSDEISLDVSATGDLMVAGYGRYQADPGEGLVTCWNLRRGEHCLLPGHDGSSVFEVAIDRAGELIVAGGGPRYGPGFVKLWNARTGTLAAELPKEGTCVTAVAMSPAGDRLAIVAAGRLAVWASLTSQPDLLWKREVDGAFRVAFSPQGDVLAVGCFGGDTDWTKKNRPTVMIWDAQTGDQLETASLDRAIMQLAFSPDGRLVASIDWNGKLEVYDRDQQRTAINEVAHETVGLSVAFSPDGRTLATASGIGDVKLWHLPTMMHITTFKTRGSVSELAFFPDGHTLAVGYLDRTIELWHVDRDKEHFSIDGAADRQ